MTDARATLAANLRLGAAGCDVLGSPFYRELEERMAADVEAGGPVWDVLGPRAAAPLEDAYALRLLGGVHKRVLAGRAPDLATHYPSTGGDGDAAAAWPHFLAAVSTGPPEVLDALTRPPQTNEVGRSPALVGGLLVVARETGLPLRLREVGASAGLNLRVDRYHYEQDGLAWGDPASPVRFVGCWQRGRPPFEAAASIVDRRGCDRDPIDATTADAGLTLLSYVWPGQAERFTLLRTALDVARAYPVPIERAEASEWVAEQLSAAAPGTATVVYHSVVWQYLDDPTRDAIRGALDKAAAHATGGAPVAWLRLEPTPETYLPAELRLTLWPGGEERLLATCGFHLGPVHWLAA